MRSLRVSSYACRQRQCQRTHSARCDASRALYRRGNGKLDKSIFLWYNFRFLVIEVQRRDRLAAAIGKEKKREARSLLPRTSSIPTSLLEHAA